MPKKYLKLLFLLAVIMVVFSVAQPALALEVTYPTIGGFSITSSSTLLDYIQYFFGFAMAVAGIIAVISIVISGLKILLAAGNPTAITDAKEQILGAVLGIALLFGSFILITTINPKLVNPSLTALPQQTLSGVLLDTIYTNEVIFGNARPLTPPYVITTRAPESESNVRPIFNNQPPNSNLTLQGSSAYRQIRYNCTPPTTGVAGPRLLLSRYSKPNFEIDRARNGVIESAWGAYPEVNTFILDCNTNPNNAYAIFPGESYKWEIEQPGVYFYLKSCKDAQNGTGVSSKVYTDPQSIEPFDCDPGAGGSDGCAPINADQTPKSMRIVNGRNNQNAGYGVILNQNYYPEGGECSSPILNSNSPDNNNLVNSICVNIPDASDDFPFDPKHAYVFQYITAPANGTFDFTSQNLYVKLSRIDFNLEDGSMYRYTGNLNNLLKECLKPDGSPCQTIDEVNASAEGSGRRLNQAVAPSVDPPPGECKNPNIPCLNGTRSSEGFYRTILYAGNQQDWLNERCQIYTCQSNNFDGGGVAGGLSGFIGNAGNRWIFNDNRKPYDTYIIPMPTAACERSQ